MQVWIVSEYVWMLENDFIIGVFDSEDKARSLLVSIESDENFDNMNTVSMQSYEVL